ncbi:MAG: GNAT family N-acetyltransferase [candidate division WOR-3 bacterium]
MALVNQNNLEIFQDKEIFEIYFEYVKRKYKFKDLGNGFIIRKVGKIRRLHYAIDDLIDWWDLDITKDEIENILKSEIYFKAVFKNILENSNIKRVLDSLNFKPKNISFSKVYYINLFELNSQEKILKSLPYNQRKNIRNYKNRLKRVNYEFFRTQSLKPYKEKIIEFILKRHKNTKFSDLDFQKLKFRVLEILENRGMIYTYIMKIHKEIASINVLIILNKKAYWWITANDEKFYEFSPGRITVWFILEDLLKEGFLEFNFMKGEAEYKTFWTNNFYKLYRYEFEPNFLKKVFSVFML